MFEVFADAVLAVHVAIDVVVAEAWLGLTCPLTTLESRLRLGGGGSGYAQSFIGHWLQRLLFWDAQPWVFALAYSAFEALVLLTGWRWPQSREQNSGPQNFDTGDKS